MEVFILIMIMVLVGALIGGLTNSIAIKMLFRPYKAIYIGKWRVPFTPGLIPKRRSELAEQLGKLVVNHLLTAEGLQKKLMDERFVHEMTEWVQKETTYILRSESSLATKLEQWIGLSSSKQKVEKKVKEWIELKIDDLLCEYRPMPLYKVMPRKLDKAIESFIPKLSLLIVEKGKNYVESPEGIEKLSLMVDRFLIGRGTFGNMISMFLGNERLVDKIQPEIIKMLNDEGTHLLIEGFIRKEWYKIKELKVEDLEKHIQIEELKQFISEKIVKQLPLNYLDKPMNEWAAIVEKPLVEEVVPRIIFKIGQALSGEIAFLLQKLKLEDVVKHQVEQFSVMRLEEMVLSISRRELKLITYLGGLLGGLIGFIQALFLLFLR